MAQRPRKPSSDQQSDPPVDERPESPTSPVAPLDDHDPEDKYGSFDGQSPQPKKGGRSSGTIGGSRQRFGNSRSDKDNKP
jgi:hypothetical protein